MEDIKEMLKRHEGLRLKVYKDTLGKSTIGYGHLLEPEEDFQTITLTQADELLEKDLQSTITWIGKNILFFGSLTQGRRNVIIDMAFNLRNHLLSFRDFLNKLSMGDNEGAANAMMDSLWAKQVGERAIELHKIILEG